MRRLLLLPVTLAFAAALLYGCDEITPTENPTVDTDPSLGRSSSRRGVKSSFKRDGDDWTVVGDTRGDHAEGVVPLMLHGNEGGLPARALGALGAGAGHVDREPPAARLVAVEGLDGLVGLAVVFHLHEAEAA